MPEGNDKDVALEALDDIALADRMKHAQDQIIAELRKTIVGQDDVIEQVLLSLFVGGNSIITGVPGLAKTLIVYTVSQVLDLNFARIQFTPDLMPSDITGTDIIQEDPNTGKRELVFMPGPIFNNIVLADEINRTPPKTQSALTGSHAGAPSDDSRTNLRARGALFRFCNSESDRVGRDLSVARSAVGPLHVQHHHSLHVGAGRVDVVRSTTTVQDVNYDHVVTGQDIVDFQKLVRRVPVSEPVMRYAVNLARTTRPGEGEVPDFIEKWLDYGASVRASQYLILGGKARALMNGRYHVSYDDIRALAPPVFRHRILTNFHAESERISSDKIIEQLLEAVPVPKSMM